MNYETGMQIKTDVIEQLNWGGWEEKQDQEKCGKIQSRNTAQKQKRD